MNYFHRTAVVVNHRYEWKQVRQQRDHFKHRVLFTTQLGTNRSCRIMLSHDLPTIRNILEWTIVVSLSKLSMIQWWKIQPRIPIVLGRALTQRVIPIMDKWFFDWPMFNLSFFQLRVVNNRKKRQNGEKDRRKKKRITDRNIYQCECYSFIFS